MKKRIYVEVEGGLVQCVYGDVVPELEIVVRDLDNINAGDEDPLPGGKTPVMKSYY